MAVQVDMHMAVQGEMHDGYKFDKVMCWLLYSYVLILLFARSLPHLGLTICTPSVRQLYANCTPTVPLRYSRCTYAVQLGYTWSGNDPAKTGQRGEPVHTMYIICL